MHVTMARSTSTRSFVARMRSARESSTLRTPTIRVERSWIVKRSRGCGPTSPRTRCSCSMKPTQILSIAGSLPPPHIDARTVRLRTFSKAYGLAGARIGYGIAAPETIAAFQKIRQHFGLNRTGQIGALAALTDQPYVADVVARVATGRAEYRALAERLGVRTLPSFTNFVCFEIGTRAQAEGMVAALLDQGVFVRKPGAAPIDGYIRVTIGTPAERAAFADVLEELLVARPV